MSNINKLGLPIVLLIFVAVTASILGFWMATRAYPILGDEPFYLMMANGIGKHGVLEQTIPLQEEFRTRLFSPAIELGKIGEPFAPGLTHTVHGPHGWFSVHNIGLPALLTLPLLLGGVIGAKVLMMCCGALVVVWAWRFASRLIEDDAPRFWAVLATCVALPLLPASTQIFPDLVAGMLSLVGLYWYFTIDRARRLPVELAFAAAVAFLPWLQIKFSPTSAILLLACLVQIYRRSKDRKRMALIAATAAVSALSLLAYNHYAFGKWSGPYEGGEIEFSRRSLMVLAGLLLDQNQGFLMQSPILMVGVFALPALWRLDRRFTVVWALVFASLIVPNALHVNWYGGVSFSGRFGWSAMTVFLVPALYGLGKLAKADRRLFYCVIAASVAVQAYLIWRITVMASNLYNNPPGTLELYYSIFYDPIHMWLPMLYDRARAYHYWPNYAWLAVVAAVFAAAWLSERALRRALPYGLLALGGLILASGLVQSKQPDETVLQASALPSLVGHAHGAARVAEKGVDSPGFLNFGPYAPLRRGRFEVIVSYSSPADPTQTAGTFDINDASGQKQIYTAPLLGTAGAVKQLHAVFALDNPTNHPFEFRNVWNGLANLTVYEIRFRAA